MDVGRLQLAPVSAEDCQEETGRSSSSRDGQEEDAGGCPKLCSPLQSTEVMITARQQLVGASSSATMAASRLNG